MYLYRKVGKRVFDIMVSALALILLCPLFLLISLAIFLDSGRPVLFIQKRVGLRGRIFPCCKFRSLRTGASISFNPDGSTQVGADDQRVTRVGNFLRRCSLDELPQLWNVLIGQMSLVGPRPDLPIHWQSYDETQRRRYLVKPGITGLAQVNGRNYLSINEKVRYDLVYVDNCSLWLDLKILVKTLGVVVCRSGVYHEPDRT